MTTSPATRADRWGWRTWLAFGWFGLTTVLFRRTDPIVGSLIVTDRCNLACRHCAVANLTRSDYPFDRLRDDVARMRADGVRILFLYGGEPMLWRDGPLTLADVVAEARAQGFPSVNVVTNGTFGLDVPGADLLFVSLDGNREHHDALRGRTYDRVLAAVEDAPAANVCLYMAVNRVNADDVEHVANLARNLPTVRAAAYNLHTPYPGTEDLTLSPEQRRDVCERIGRLAARRYPILNLPAALPRLADLRAPLPCPQCILVEDGRRWTCGRCADVPGLCEQCGFSFATELSLLFRGDPRVILDALRVYRTLL